MIFVQDPAAGIVGEGDIGETRETESISTSRINIQPILKGIVLTIMLVSKLLKSLDRKVCVVCDQITKRCTDKGFCDKCDEKRPLASKISGIYLKMRD